MNGIIELETERGMYVVTDDSQNVWECLEADGSFAIIWREDSQRYYGATFMCDAGGSAQGTIYPKRDGDEIQGANEVYRFSESTGWVSLDS